MASECAGEYDIVSTKSFRTALLVLWIGIWIVATLINGLLFAAVHSTAASSIGVVASVTKNWTKKSKEAV